MVAVPTENILQKADCRTRATHDFKFRTISSKTAQYKHSFYPSTIPEWNKLPNETVNATSVNAFKSILKKRD